MKNKFCAPSALLLLAILSTSFCLPWSTTAAYTPDDPQVLQMVTRGVNFLEGKTINNARATQFRGRAGEVVLAGYAHFKCRHDANSPVVKKGVAMAMEIIDALKQGKGDEGKKRNYEISICVLLLAEVNAGVYRNQLQFLQGQLMSQQHPGGGFRYPGDELGDVSQTQYAVLAIWTLDRKGIPLNYGKVAACTQWLLRVQDRNGAWPYKGEDPGRSGSRIQQHEGVGISMGLAGGSSVLIAGDAMRLWGEASDENDPNIPGMPKAIRLYKEDENNKRRKKTKKVSQSSIMDAIDLYEKWDNSNPYAKRPSKDWYYYIIYTRERYESYLEIARGGGKDRSPAWYNQIVDELKAAQDSSGGWTEPSLTTDTTSTSLALLTLIRSTQKSISNISSGVLGGARGFPADTTNLREEGTKIKGEAVSAQVSDLLSILSEDSGDLNGRDIPDNLQLDTNPDGRRAQLDRLERMVRGSRSYKARRVAARMLGKSDELRVVPSLIYALDDLDTPTRKFARDGLRFISRKFDGFGLPKKPIKSEIEEEKYAEMLSLWRADAAVVQNRWRDWYRTIDPTYIFLDYDL